MIFAKSAYFLTILIKIENNREKGPVTWRALICRYLFARIRYSGRQILSATDGRDLFFWSSPVRRPAAMSAARAAASGGVPAVYGGSESADKMRRTSAILLVSSMETFPPSCGNCGRTEAMNGRATPATDCSCYGEDRRGKRG
jgi:hypothetical protein